jgi:hypothetical protein
LAGRGLGAVRLGAEGQTAAAAALRDGIIEPTEQNRERDDQEERKPKPKAR